jgi:hypothetical protein
MVLREDMWVEGGLKPTRGVEVEITGRTGLVDKFHNSLTTNIENPHILPKEFHNHSPNPIPNPNPKNRNASLLPHLPLKITSYPSPTSPNYTQNQPFQPSILKVTE